MNPLSEFMEWMASNQVQLSIYKDYRVLMYVVDLTCVLESKIIKVTRMLPFDEVANSMDALEELLKNMKKEIEEGKKDV